MLNRYIDILIVAAVMVALYVAQNRGILTDVQVQAILAAVAAGGIPIARRMKPPDKPDDSDPPIPKHRMPVAIVLLCLGCGAVPTGNDEVDELAWGLCEKHGAACVGSSTKSDIGLDEYLSDFYWGRYSWGEIEIPHTEESVPYGIVCWDNEKCAEDLDVCAGVILHEIGHQEAGRSQLAADCWAVENADEESQAIALRDLVCSWRDDEPGRCDSIRQCYSGRFEVM